MALAAAGICTGIALFVPLETTTMKILGSFLSVPLVALAAWKFPRRFYVLAFLFQFCAAPLGSAVNLYHYIGAFDKFVHYLSGIVLAEAGVLIFLYLCKKSKLPEEPRLTLLFAFFFAAACAGFWEIYEFTADHLLGINMQGNNTNTMGDIISGVLGALTYCGIRVGMQLQKHR